MLLFCTCLVCISVNSLFPFRCVPKSKCGGNKVSRRSGGLLGLQVAAADEAKCDNDSDICCSEKEITQECSDYAQDGYKCASTCYDVPQDFPSKDERKTIISPYLPKVLQSIIFPEEPSLCQYSQVPNKRVYLLNYSMFSS